MTLTPKVLLSVLPPGATLRGSPIAQRPDPHGWVLHLFSLLLSTSDFSKSVVVLLITDKYFVGNQYSPVCTVVKSGDLKMKSELT